MAKKITADEQNPAGGETLHPVMENTALGNEGNTGETPPVAGQTGKETLPVTETKPVTENLPPFVESILKTFSFYESLYIDAQGGIYAPETHPAVRGNATLYKNPHYRSSFITHNFKKWL
jgi:hypothetical protein